MFTGNKFEFEQSSAAFKSYVEIGSLFRLQGCENNQGSWIFQSGICETKFESPSAFGRVAMIKVEKFADILEWAVISLKKNKKQQSCLNVGTLCNIVLEKNT